MTVRLWLRDDDAGPFEPRLAGFLAWLADAGIPAALAVVPGWLEAEAVCHIRGRNGIVVFQHGIAHANHARPGEKKIELGGAADPAELRDGLLRGREALRRAFGEQFVPVLVPPWNRIAPAIERALPELGYIAVSTFRGRPAPAVPGLLRVDSDVDVMDWRARRLRPRHELDAELDALCAEHDSGPVGILTHHRAEAAADTTVLRDWLGSLAKRRDVEWLDPRAPSGVRVP